MAKSQFRSKKKISGKKYIPFRKKRLCELAGNPTLSTIGVKKTKVRRVKGANRKTSILSSEIVNVSTKGKIEKLKILSVVENPSNVNYTRRNIITKGCIIKTEKGNVKITSKPGQVATLNGIFLEN